MVIVRPTSSLGKRMRVKLDATQERSSTLLGDWHALDLVLDHQQYILCVSENGRLPVILKAAPYVSFPNRLAVGLSEVLLKIGVPLEKVQDEVSKMDKVIVAKTNNRSILGSMNEFRFQLQASDLMGHYGHDTTRLSVVLSDTISLVLPDYTPLDTVLKLFGQPKAKRPRRPYLSIVS